jgi:hypothetical protein
MQKSSPLPPWDSVLTAAARLQRIVPDAVVVGGTAAALHAGHRVSHDADHVLPDLRGRFDEILGQLESVAGWRTARITRPVQILGSLDGVETGIRQLIRSAPLEVERKVFAGQEIVLPTPEEMLRVKAILILRRNATRDYLDFAAMALHLGERGAEAMLPFDRLYPQENGESPTQQVIVQLSCPLPYDLDGLDLGDYRGLAPAFRSWETVRGHCLDFAALLLDRVADSRPQAIGNGHDDAGGIRP